MPRVVTTTALLYALLFTAPLVADIHLTKKRDADEFSFSRQRSPGAKDQKVEIWIGPDRVRRDDGRTALILRLDQKKLYLIDHTERTYTVTALRQQRGGWTAPKQGVNVPGAKAWRVRAKVEPTGETRQVGSWQASRHRVVLSNEVGTADRIRLDWWVAPDLKIDDGPLRALMRILASASGADGEWISTVLDLPGHPVLFERVEKQPEVDVKIREELVSVQEGDAPAGSYEPPAGYRILDFGEYEELHGWPSPL